MAVVASRIEHFEVTIPAETAVATPQTTNLEFPDGIVRRIELLIPPGPSGLVGFRFDYGGQRIIPRTPGSMFVADGEVVRWDIERFPTGGQWQLVAHNTDVFTHTLFIRLFIDEFGDPTQPVVPVPVPIPVESAPPDELLDLGPGELFLP